MKREVDLEENVVDIQPGDLYLLFSDGVTNMIEDTLLLGLIRAHRDEGLDVLAQAIVDTANENGGRDNISVVAIDVGETETPELIKESKVTLAEPLQMSDKRFQARPIRDGPENVSRMAFIRCRYERVSRAGRLCCIS